MCPDNTEIWWSDWPYSRQARLILRGLTGFYEAKLRWKRSSKSHKFSSEKTFESEMKHSWVWKWNITLCLSLVQAMPSVPDSADQVFVVVIYQVRRLWTHQWELEGREIKLSTWTSSAINFHQSLLFVAHCIDGCGTMWCYWLTGLLVIECGTR